MTSTSEAVPSGPSSTPAVAEPVLSSYSPDFVDPTPPGFKEIESTHTPLLSIAYFIHSHCKPYSDDYMLCKRDQGDPAACALEGRRVTRCAQDLMTKMSAACAQQWDQHWQCLEKNNNYYWKCREKEQSLNQCAFKAFGYKKVIPDAPDYEVPVHMRPAEDCWYK